jgi:hypothetical protein
MLNITLDSESAEYLAEILTQENITSDELVKQLLHDRWLALQPQPTILERMGGYPEGLLQGPVDESMRAKLRQVAGCMQDAPADLSTNPAYMEGFGQ